MITKSKLGIKPHDFDQETDQKLRLTNELKRLQDQILVSERVGAFMKKFDRKRLSTNR